MTSDGLPPEAEPPISEDVRQRGIDIVRGQVASGKLGLERFEPALQALLEAHGEAGFAAVLRSLPPPVAFTAPARRRHEPLEISSPIGDVRLDGRWQVSRVTRIDAGMGSVIIDLTDAEFDDWEVEIVAHTKMGMVTVIAPRGLDVRLVGANGAVNSTIEPPIPGFPVVRLSATTDMGLIRVMHPGQKAKPHKARRRRRWRARRSRP